ncbi:MAG: glycosyltransferase [Acidobacteriota bacterium]|nr:glycosyltransferase [Acidobacteriota bacterium]
MPDPGRALPKTLVVIPAYNEAENIAEVVTRATAHAPVVVVNDGSKDRTGEIAAALPRCSVINHARNTHIPGAIKDGFQFAIAQGYDYAITMDAGLSHDPGLITQLMAQPDTDLVLSYRPAPENVPLYRRVLSRSAALLVNAAIRQPRWQVWRPGYKDVTSGYRRYSRRAMQAVLDAPMVARSFDFHLEALAVISYAGLGIREFPITYVFSNSSLTRGVVGQAFRTWLRLLAGLHRPS